jgi:putative DNA primase/helicase
MQTNPLLTTALEYGAKQWQVLPVHWVMPDGGCSCRNGKDCHSPGKHPILRSWEHNSSSHTQTITDWWTKYPVANIGIAVGVSRLVVVDVDGQAGLDSLRALEAEYEPLPATLRHRTGAGGFHMLYFDGGYTTPTRASLRPKLDIRGEGGMIVAPPSLHRSGRRYEVMPGPTAPATMPFWMRTLIRKTPRFQPRPDLPPRPKSKYITLGDPGDLAAAIYKKLLKK